MSTSEVQSDIQCMYVKNSEKKVLQAIRLTKPNFFVYNLQ